MANGDIAADAGLPVVPATAKLNLGYDEINRTRDLIVTQTEGLEETVDAVNRATATATAGVLLEGGTGGRINVGTPQTVKNATTKEYVDAHLLELETRLQATLATLAERVSRLEEPHPDPENPGE